MFISVHCGNSIIMHGIIIAQFASLHRKFVKLQKDLKVELVPMGFCTSGNGYYSSVDDG